MAITGHSGSVTVAGNVSAMGNAKNWTLEISQETAETTSFGSNGWKESTPTLNAWSGSITCIFDASGADEGALQTSLTGGSVVALELKLGGGTGSYDTYSGNAIIVGQSTATDVSGIVEVTFNFEGTGTLAIA